MILRVCQAAKDDLYKDFVRIPEVHRVDIEGRRVKNGEICEISVDGGIGTTLTLARGMIGITEPCIFMDEKTRLDLGITDQSEHDFRLVRVGWLKQFKWAWDASHPIARI